MFMLSFVFNIDGVIVGKLIFGEIYCVGEILTHPPHKYGHTALIIGLKQSL